MDDIIIGVVTISIGTLINFILTKLYKHYTGTSKTFFWKDKYLDLLKQKSLDDFEEIKKRTRIIVIDDENSFPVSIFENEGYSINKWDSVKDYQKLESGFYDIIVLDIKGVAEHISEDDGIGVLVDLKEKNPSQIIISFSQHSYDLNKVKFFQLADDNITKPSDYLKIKRTIDNLISTKFKPDRYVDALENLLKLNNISQKDIKKVNDEISKAITKKEKPNLSKTLSSINNKSDFLKQVISLSDTILKFFQ
ncbi:hypothetical protein [Roseivirga seohaensis]|uniref:hypothetical protein n=1 Tax=Roseivirga seohaensis TaxID=1914963 RepID=UPI003BAD1390